MYRMSLPTQHQRQDRNMIPSSGTNVSSGTENVTVGEKSRTSSLSQVQEPQLLLTEEFKEPTGASTPTLAQDDQQTVWGTALSLLVVVGAESCEHSLCLLLLILLVIY
jgi:hypothetical protein